MTNRSPTLMTAGLDTPAASNASPRGERIGRASLRRTQFPKGAWYARWTCAGPTAPQTSGIDILRWLDGIDVRTRGRRAHALDLALRDVAALEADAWLQNISPSVCRGDWRSRRTRSQPMVFR